MSVVSRLKKAGKSGFGYGSTAEEVTEGLDLSGKTYLVTGCSSGLGLETMRVLSRRGAHVLAAARDEAKATDAIARVGAAATPLACELSEPTSVRGCIARVQALARPLDAIICNAGIMALPKLQTKYGLELQFLTNHIGHFMLVTALIDSLAERGRVVMLSSAAHHRAPRAGIELDNLNGARGYSPWAAYGQSKLANLLVAKQLARRLHGSGRIANAVHPGVIATHLGRHMNAAARAALAVARPLFLKSIAQGAATQCYVATHPAAAELSGEYFADCNVARPSPRAQDAQLAAQLWQASEEIVARLERETAG